MAYTSEGSQMPHCGDSLGLCAVSFIDSHLLTIRRKCYQRCSSAPLSLQRCQQILLFSRLCPYQFAFVVSISCIGKLLFSYVIFQITLLRNTFASSLELDLS